MGRRDAVDHGAIFLDDDVRRGNAIERHAHTILEAEAGDLKRRAAGRGTRVGTEPTQNGPHLLVEADHFRSEPQLIGRRLTPVIERDLDIDGAGTNAAVGRVQSRNCCLFPQTSDAFQNVSAGTTISTGTEPPSIGTSVSG